MKIRTKLIIGFSIMIVLICGMVFVGNDVIKDTRAEFEVLEQHIVPGAIETSVMKVRVNELRALTLNYGIKGDIAKKDITLREEIRRTINDLEGIAEYHREHETDIDLVEQKEAEELESMVKQFCSAAMEIVNLKDQGMDIDTLVEKREELFHPVLTPLLGQLEEHTAAHMKELEQAGRTINQTYDLGLRLFFLMAGLLTVIAVIVTVVVTRSITKPLLALHRGTEIIGEGNLDYKVATKAKDEIGQLSRAFDEMTDNLKKSTTSVDSLNQEIVERKRAEETLRQYEHIVSSSTDMLALVDKWFNYLAANKAYIKAFNLSPEQLIGNTVANVFGEEFFNTVIKPNADRCLGGEEVNYQDWFDYPVYGQCYMDITYYPYYSENNEIVGFAMNGRNITERKKVEEALKKSEALLTETGRTAKVGGWEIDAKTLEVIWTEETYRIHEVPLGTKPTLEEAINYFHPDDRPRLKTAIQKAIEHGEPYDMEIRFITARGKHLWTHTICKPIIVEGKTVKLTGIFQDITERKKAEENIQQQNEFLNKVMESLTHPFYVINAHDYTIKMANSAAGYVSALKKATCHSITHNSDEPCQSSEHQCPLEIVKKTKKPVMVEHVHFDKDGNRRNVEVYGYPIFDKKGNVIQMIEYCLDITERKQAEKELEEKNQQLQSQSTELKDKARELEVASQAKSEFLASMSHELRTPLNAVIGFSELMIDEVPGEINEEQKQCLDDILSSGHHLLELINDVLDLSKVEAGKMEFRAEELKLSEVVHEVTQTVKPLVNKAGHSMKVNIAEELPLVYADKSRLRQVFINILSNAIKYTPDGGQIRIEAHQEGNYCQVSVSDNGLGIKPEDQERVFEVFAQVETLAENKKEGTGLGLPLTRQFVEKMGGRIWLESEYGKGSCFSLTIPLVGEDERQPEKEEEHEQRLSKIQKNSLRKGKLILVVDDDRNARTLLRSWLETAGYSIVEATNGDEGISKAKELQPALIILDILMPGKDGWQVIQELKQLPETKEIPVIISTMTTEEELGFSLGAVDFFVKPVDKKRFLKHIERLVISEEKKVLVVEDNPADMRLVTSILEAEGIATICACDGEEGLRMAKEHLPALIVLDINMPRMNGFELIEKLNEEEKLTNIPVIILTVKDLTQAETRILSQKAEAILKKMTFSREELLTEIKKLV